MYLFVHELHGEHAPGAPGVAVSPQRCLAGNPHFNGPPIVVRVQRLQRVHPPGAEAACRTTHRLRPGGRNRVRATGKKKMRERERETKRERKIERERYKTTER